MPRIGKTKKALMKRFKITGKKRFLHRACGQNHFLAKKSGNKTRAARLTKHFDFLPKTLKTTIAK